MLRGQYTPQGNVERQSRLLCRSCSAVSDMRQEGVRERLPAFIRVGVRVSGRAQQTETEHGPFRVGTILAVIKNGKAEAGRCGRDLSQSCGEQMQS